MMHSLGNKMSSISFTEFSELNYDMSMKTERSWSDLPQEILRLIISRLYLGDLNVFHAVCRSWRLITPIAGFTPFPPPMDSLLSESPCLLTVGKRGSKLFHPILNSTYEMDFPELSNSRICFSNNGWVLMSRGLKSIFFFNPFTKEKIQLPDLPYENVFREWPFSPSPMSKKCLVVGIHYCLYDFWCCMMWFGDGEANEWIDYLTTMTSDVKFEFSDCCPIFCQGKLYFLGRYGNMGIFNTENTSWKICGKPFLKLGVCRYFMVEEEGELLGVFVISEVGRIEMVKYDLNGGVLEKKVGSLGVKMLFLSYWGSICVKSGVRGMENKLYLAKFFGESGVFYSPSTKEYHSFDGRRGLAYCELAEQVQCTWIEPHFHRPQ